MVFQLGIALAEKMRIRIDEKYAEAERAATATATAATGGIAIIFAGGFALLGAFPGRAMLNDSQGEAYKKEYRSAIAATMHVIGPIVAAIVSTSNEHVTDQATTAFDTLTIYSIC